MSQAHRFIFRAPDPPAHLEPLNVGSSDIAEWLLARDPQAILAYGDMAADEYAKAFAVARTLNADVIDDLYYNLIDTFDRGGTVHDFRDGIMPTLKAKGWLRGNETEIASRLNLIFYTNANRAMADFDYDKAIKNAKLMPYRTAFSAEDGRVRHPPHSKSDHRAWDGITLPITHPFWAKWGTRHIGFGCRCNSAALTRSQYARGSYAETSADDLAQREARLGAPVFASPAASTAAKVAGIIGDTNANAMPGLPPVDAAQAIADGQRAANAAVEQAHNNASIARLLDLGMGVRPADPPQHATETSQDIASEFSAVDAMSRLTAATQATLRHLRAKRSPKAS